MSAGFTPGPWSLGKRRKHRVSIDGVGWIDLARVVVALNEDMDGAPQENAIGAANARLIAAAPDLYEALKEYMACVAMAVGVKGADVLTISEVHDRMDAALLAAQTALAKATSTPSHEQEVM